MLPVTKDGIQVHMCGRQQTVISANPKCSTVSFSYDRPSHAGWGTVHECEKRIIMNKTPRNVKSVTSDDRFPIRGVLFFDTTLVPGPRRASIVLFEVSTELVTLCGGELGAAHMDICCQPVM